MCLHEKPTGPTWEERAAAIEQTFRQLPIKKLSSDFSDIPPEYFIPGFARDLLITAQAKRVQKKSPKKSIRDLKRSVGALLRNLEAMPPEAEDALKLTLAALREFRLRLYVVKAAADAVDASAVADAADAEVRRIKKKTKPVEIQARNIVKKLGWYYYMLTGKKPTVPKRDGEAYGAFPGLVRRNFEILEVKAKPISQAEYVARKWPLVLREHGKKRPKN